MSCGRYPNGRGLSSSARNDAIFPMWYHRCVHANASNSAIVENGAPDVSSRVSRRALSARRNSAVWVSSNVFATAVSGGYSDVPTGPLAKKVRVRVRRRGIERRDGNPRKLHIGESEMPDLPHHRSQLRIRPRAGLGVRNVTGTTLDRTVAKGKAGTESRLDHPSRSSSSRAWFSARPRASPALARPLRPREGR